MAYTKQQKVISEFARVGFKRIPSELMAEIDKRIQLEISADEIVAEIYRRFRAELLSSELGVNLHDPEYQHIELMVNGVMDDSTIRWVIKAILAKRT